MTRPDGVIARSAAHLRSLWSQDRAAFGLWAVLSDPTTAELVAGTGFDYVVVDLQHGVATFSELPGMLQAMRAADRAPLVRVPWNDAPGVMRALDSGAAGVIVPMVSSPADAVRAAQACRFPPSGNRSWGPMWGGIRADGALPPAEQDDAALCLVMVETAEGVEALEEIVAVPGVDGVYIGPNDLALSCGYGRSTYRDSTEVDALLQRIVDTCRAAGVVVGLHCSDAQMALDWADRGVRMATAGHEASLLRTAADDLWAAVSPRAPRTP